MLFTEIRLKTNYLSTLHYFYKEVLEFTTFYSEEKSITVIAGTSKLIFEETNSLVSPFYHFAFNIPNNKFDEAYQGLKNKLELLWLDDYRSYIADFVNWHAKSFYFNDPSGNILELITRFDLNDSVDEKFSSKHVRNVSEIGLVYPMQSFDNDVGNCWHNTRLLILTNNPHYHISGRSEMMKDYLSSFRKTGFGFLQKIQHHKFFQCKLFLK